MRDYTTTNVDLETLAHKMKINLIGIYSKDKLPKKCYVGGYIVNLEDNDAGSGTHWVSLYITKKKEILYFDSFGMPPSREIKEFVNYKPRAINTIELQKKKSTPFGYY